MISDQDLFGNFLPNIHIDRIVLESSGGELPPRRNPHIKEEDNRTIKVKKGMESGMRVSVDFSIKYRIGNDPVSAWFKDANLKNYLKIRIVQSTDATTSNNITLIGQELPNNMGENVRIIDLSITDILGAASDKETDKLVKNYTSLDSDGNSIVEMSFNQKFALEIDNPMHLSYFTFSSIDLEKLAEDNDVSLDLDEGVMHLLNGKISSEMVIDKKKVVSNSYIYHIDAPGSDMHEEQWFGQIHKMQDGRWMTGEYMDEDGSLYLSQHKVQNNKIQDFRYFDKISRLEVDLSTFEKDVFSSEVKSKFRFLKSQNPVPTVAEPYFSDIYLAADKLNRAKFAFAVDYHKIIRDESVFGRLYKDDVFGTLSEESKILSMNIKRRRVKKDGTIFDKKEPIVTLITTTDDPSTTGILKSSNDDGGVSELNASVNNKNGIRFFNGYDTSVGDLTDGLYQYGIELTIQDNTARLLKEKLSNLLLAKQRIDRYYKKGTTLGLTSILSEVANPHIDDLSWERAASMTSSSGNYDPVSNRFTQNFIEETLEKYEGITTSAPWIAPVYIYFNALSLLTDFDKNPKSAKVQKDIIKMVKPDTGNPKSVKAVMKAMEDLIAKYEQVLGVKKSRNRNAKTAKDYSSANTSPATNIKIEYWFKEFHDSTVARNFGYDYLSSSLMNMTSKVDGLKSVSSSGFKTRTKNETYRYYSNMISDKDASWSNLTPSFCHLGSMGVDDVFNFHTTGKYSEYSTLEAKIMMYNTTSEKAMRVPRGHGLKPSDNFHSYEARDFKHSMADFYSNLNLTVLPTQGVLSNEDNINSIELDPDLNPNALYLSLMKTFSDSGIANHNSTDSSFVKQSKTVKIRKREIDVQEAGVDMIWKHLPNLSIDNSYRRNIINSSGYKFKFLTRKPSAKQVIEHLPLQIRALKDTNNTKGRGGIVEKFSSAIDPSKNIETSSYFRFRYSMINRIEVLSGFIGDDSRIKKPLWRPLSYKDWLSSKNGDALICRMVPFECSVLGIDRPKGLELPVYDNYFILQPERVSVSSVNQSLYKSLDKWRKTMGALNARMEK